MSRDWVAQERAIANHVRGTRNAGSGAFGRKGDIRGSDIVVEAKWTGKKQITIRAEWLEKICGEAMAEGRTPVLVFEVNGRNYAVLEWNDYLQMREEVMGSDSP